MIAVIIVNYKNECKTINYVQNELSKIRSEHIVIIVNNGATTETNFLLSNSLSAELIGTPNDVNISDKQIFIISSFENLGFAKGNNLGVLFAINHFRVSHLLFSNNDIRILSTNTVEVLVNKINELQGVGAIGPKILGLDNKNQSPEPYISFFNRYFWLYWLTPFISNNSKIKLFKLDYSEKATEGFHYKIMGSFFLMKSNSFVNCGMMDPNTFLYAEEVILSERLASIGEKCYYYPNVEVLHEHSITISEHLSQRKSTLTLFKSESYYYTRYKKVSSISILLGKFSLLLYLKIKKYLK